MKIKEREKSNFFKHLKKVFLILSKIFWNKKIKILMRVLIIIITLVIGILIGLLFSKFFGPLDNVARDVGMFLNIGGLSLRDEKFVVDGILAENIKIPFNWIKGQFSNPEKIFIDINFENYQKLEYKRQQALELGVLLTSAEDYVPATITHNGKKYNVRLRLKGDHVDHLNTDKWSFRIKIRGDDALFGMKIFSLQHPKTRIYINELVYHLACKKENIISLRYKFVEVIINGENKGILALEEHFAKELIENNNRREGIFLKFSEDVAWEEYLKRSHLSLSFDELFQTSIIETFDNDEMLEDPFKKVQFEKAKNLLESFRLGKLKTHEVFDSDKFAKYYAILTLLDARHGGEVQNLRFYYNPITSLLEPVSFDGFPNPTNAEAAVLGYLPPCLILDEGPKTCFPDNTIFDELLFSDEVFFKKYVQELEKISEKSYIDDLFDEIDPEIKKSTNILYKDYPFMHFSKKAVYHNQEQIKEMLNIIQGINAYFQEKVFSENKIILSVRNIDPFPLEIVNLEINGTIATLHQRKVLQSWNSLKEVEYEKVEFYLPSEFEWKDEYIQNLKLSYKILGAKDIKNVTVIAWQSVEEDFIEKDFIRQKSNLSSFEMLNVNEDTKLIFIKKGSWILNESLVIPPGFSVITDEGTSIDLVNNSMILSYSPINFQGTENNHINIFSTDGTGQGLSVFNSKDSSLKYVNFDNLASPSKEGWSLTGAINFYESPVNFNHVKFSNLKAEDSLNIINSKFKIENSIFEHCFSDCLDNDFSEGELKNSIFINCGNDCIDISGTTFDIINVTIINAGDKGVSAGEKSNLTISNMLINKSNIGIASKDLSNVSINHIEIFNSEYGFAVYQKKPEYGPALIDVKIVNFLNLENNYIVEKESKLNIDDVIILNNEKNVYEKLYGEN